MAVVDRLNQPNTPEDCFDTWKHRGRLAVPTKDGTLVEVRIEQILNMGAAIQIWGRTHNEGTLRKFMVRFDDRARFELPTLFWKDGRGEWIRKSPSVDR